MINNKIKNNFNYNKLDKIIKLALLIFKIKCN